MAHGVSVFTIDHLMFSLSKIDLSFPPLMSY